MACSRKHCVAKAVIGMYATSIWIFSDIIWEYVPFLMPFGHVEQLHKHENKVGKLGDRHDETHRQRQEDKSAHTAKRVSGGKSMRNWED
jgi:hypothetical protein